MMMMRLCRIMFGTISIFSIVNGESWEIERSTSGDSYSPPRFAISLQDHNSAFSSSAYCVDTAPPYYANDLARDLCDECAGCEWKQRQGFTTEQEWQSAVKDEMTRLEEGGGEERVGSWILEAHETMKINLDIMDKLSSSLGMSLENLVVSDRDSRRRFFVVSGTPGDVANAMLVDGFISMTPIPPRLKIHPSLEEGATAVASGDVGLVSPLRNLNKYVTDEEEDSNEDWHGIRAELAPSPPVVPSTSSTSSAAAVVAAVAPSKLRNLLLGSTNNTSTGNATTTTVGDTKELSTVAEWVEAVANHHGDHDTEIVAEGDQVLTVQGLHSRATAYAAALDIARHGGVLWVTPHAPPSSAGFFASKMVQKWPPQEIPGGVERRRRRPRGGQTWDKEVPPLHKMGLLGQGAVVGVAELGPMDFNSCFFEDEKVKVKFEEKEHKTGTYEVFESTTHRKLRQYVIGHRKGWGGAAGENSVSLKHATWVVGALVGKPNLDDLQEKEEDKMQLSELQRGTGAAPEAKVAFFEGYKNGGRRKKSLPKTVARVFKPTYFGLVHTMREDVFPRAYSVGVRVYSMSFGYARGGYKSGDVDAYCFRNQDFIVLVAAGNKGAPMHNLKGGKGGGGGTIVSPATAKSAVAVGSHENYDPEFSNRPHYLLSDFSSRGPTSDGRIKPEVCGPGEDVVVAAPPTSSDALLGSRSCAVDEVDGTSFAAPTVAGVTVLVRQYFTEGYYPKGVKDPKNGFEPMGALLKAILVNSGKALYTTEEEAKRRIDKTPALPNNDQGWGAVEVTSSLITPWSPKHLALQVFGQWSEGCADCPQLYTGQSCEYSFEVKNKGKMYPLLPLKVTLVWFDYHAHSSASKKTINNLDLSVQQLGSGGGSNTHFFPNGRQDPDEKNTVEHITIPRPIENGNKFIVKVKATSVPMPAQPFALVVSGPFDSSDVSVVYHPQDGGGDEERGRCGNIKKEKQVVGPRTST